MIHNQGDAISCGSSLRTVMRISPSCDCPVYFSVFKISLLVIAIPFAKYLCLPYSDIVFLLVARNSSANLGFWLNFAFTSCSMISWRLVFQASCLKFLICCSSASLQLLVYYSHNISCCSNITKYHSFCILITLLQYLVILIPERN